MRALSSGPALPRFCRPLELHLKACSDSKGGTERRCSISAGEGIPAVSERRRRLLSVLSVEARSRQKAVCGLPRPALQSDEESILLKKVSEDRGLPKVPIGSDSRVRGADG